ncbi:MAG: DMT family transporter [Candidatus Aenigmarchaeota archaeon]|nr:DMT family transporter [Candidatus Aenigmarchaeota archaeon]
MAFGVVLALVAALSWGMGDFLLQRSTRKIGDWETLFIVALLGVVALTPFVAANVAALVIDPALLVLLAAGGFMVAASVLDFEALKKGKIAVVEPLFALEVPIAALLAFGIVSETLAWFHAVLIIFLLAGLFLVSVRTHHLRRAAWLERGVLLAIIGSVFMGASAFLVGFSARLIDPLVTMWFINAITVAVALAYLFRHRSMGSLVADINRNRKLLLVVGVVDNLAWISFSFATSLIPIAIAIGLSESYIALAALLGLLVNGERLVHHQQVGIVLAFCATLVLAVVT